MVILKIRREKRDILFSLPLIRRTGPRSPGMRGRILLRARRRQHGCGAKGAHQFLIGLGPEEPPRARKVTRVKKSERWERKRRILTHPLPWFPVRHLWLQTCQRQRIADLALAPENIKLGHSKERNTTTE